MASSFGSTSSTKRGFSTLSQKSGKESTKRTVAEHALSVRNCVIIIILWVVFKVKESIFYLVITIVG